MSTANVTGWIHSIQSLGTVDGPGVRFVTFLQGCTLRCQCCHNPDTWPLTGGTPTTAQELAAKALRYREYFGAQGGVTLSGGEPLLQARFAREYFALCKKNGLHTCLDTSGVLMNDEVSALFDVTDRVLLDIKYTNDADYRTYVGCSLELPLRFLEELQRRGIPVTLRQVIIPTLNDSPDNILALKKLATAHSCVDKIELLAFRKICLTKYDALQLKFPLAHLPEPSAEHMAALKALLPEYC